MNAMTLLKRPPAIPPKADNAPKVEIDGCPIEAMQRMAREGAFRIKQRDGLHKWPAAGSAPRVHAEKMGQTVIDALKSGPKTRQELSRIIGKSRQTTSDRISYAKTCCGATITLDRETGLYTLEAEG